MPLWSLTLLLITMSFGFEVHAEANKIAEYWQKAGITFETFQKRYVSEERCYESEATFIGCVQALKSLAEVGEHPATLAIDADSDPRFGARIGAFGGLTLRTVNLKAKTSKSPHKLS